MEEPMKLPLPRYKGTRTGIVSFHGQFNRTQYPADHAPDWDERGAMNATLNANPPDYVVPDVIVLDSDVARLEAAYQVLLGTLADIAFSDDLTVEGRRAKAERIYTQYCGAEEP